MIPCYFQPAWRLATTSIRQLGVSPLPTPTVTKGRWRGLCPHRREAMHSCFPHSGITCHPTDVAPSSLQMLHHPPHLAGSQAEFPRRKGGREVPGHSPRELSQPEAYRKGWPRTPLLCCFELPCFVSKGRHGALLAESGFSPAAGGLGAGWSGDPCR